MVSKNRYIIACVNSSSRCIRRRLWLSVLLAVSVFGVGACATKGTVAKVAKVAKEAPTSFVDDRNWQYTPSDSNLQAREWFQDAKFGIFIHWGIYSLMAGAGDHSIAEWVMEQKQISISKYERLASYFNPVKFNADEWVKSFKDAGAKYITITSKHHDGFAIYDSAASNYDIADSTPFKRDILAELKSACDKHGLKLFFYYSQLDWHHPDYFPRGNTGKGYTGRSGSGDFDKYIDYQNTQIKELLTNYGNIGGFWFDGWWDQQHTPMQNRWRLKETYQLIHKLQPQALIINNHHVVPFPGEDVQPFEQDLPGDNKSGFNTSHVSSEMPLEMAITMNGSWGFNLVDDNFKSTETLLKTLISTAGRNANFLMNTGPLPDGTIQKENLQTFKEMGQWLRKYGEVIYNTRGGPIKPQPWGVTTQSDKAIYINILEPTQDKLFLPLTGRFKAANIVGDGSAVEIDYTDDGILIAVPALTDRDNIVSIRLVK